MTKRQICRSCPTIAVCDHLGGLEIKHIECGADDYLYIVSGSAASKIKYHKLKIYYGSRSTYINFRGHRYPLNMFIKV